MSHTGQTLTHATAARVSFTRTTLCVTASCPTKTRTHTNGQNGVTICTPSSQMLDTVRVPECSCCLSTGVVAEHGSGNLFPVPCTASAATLLE